MSYDLAQFVADCRSTLQADPGPAGRERIRQLLEHLLRERDFIDRHCSDSTPAGLHLLHEDAELGFQILAHINEKARVSPPHDHGHSWAIYGQAASYTDMTEFERVDDGTTGKSHLRVTAKYRLNPGQAGIYQDGAIHSIDYPDKSRFVRVTGANLDRIIRSMYDLETGAVRQMTPQRAT
jgi:predicted metal-dependent enzyme (double-stranded beta helix superfamily)